MTGLVMSRVLNRHKTGWSYYALTSTADRNLYLPRDEDLKKVFKDIVKDTRARNAEIEVAERTSKSVIILMTAGTEDWVRAAYRRALEKV